MGWFRAYDTIVDDPKVQRLPADIFKAWMNILCLCSRNHGVVPSVDDLAFSLRLPEDRVRDVLSSLEGAALLDRDDAGQLVPHNWNKLQFKSDTSTSRVKHHRERKREQVGSVSGNANETFHETHQSRAETEQSRADTQAPPKDNSASEISRINEILGFDPSDWGKHLRNVETLVALKADGCDLEKHIIPAARKASGKAKSLAYIAQSARELRDGEKLAKAAMNAPQKFEAPSDWGVVVANFNTKGLWSSKWGPKPGEAGCLVPAELLLKDHAA